MKKMIMLACVALAAAFANAAAVEWSVSGLQAADGKTPASYNYIFLCDTTEADIQAQLAEGTLTGGVAPTSSTKRGVTTWSASGASTTAAGVGDAVTGYLVVLDTATETYSLIAKSGEVSAALNKAVFDFGSGAGTLPSTPTGHGGGDDPIPEPTSGILLLVGGAVLALRRKQK